MCGIGGFRRYGDEPIVPSMVKVMLHSLEHRGNGATGVAIQHTDGSIVVLKDDEPAWRFAADKATGEWLDKHLPDAITVLCHTRAPTKGSPRNNDNNHPCFNGKVAIVHNGVLQNDDELFKELKLPRVGEVDSDLIRAMLDAKGLTKQGIELLRKLRGSAAIAAISTEQPGGLLLARSGSPIVLSGTKDFLVWASTKEAIHASMRPWVNRFGIAMMLSRPDLALTTMANHSAYLFGNEPHQTDGGPSYLKYHDKFEINKEYTPPTYNIHGKYRAIRVRWYTDKNPDVVMCRNPECGVGNIILKHHATEPLWKLVCDGCSMPLGERPEVGEN